VPPRLEFDLKCQFVWHAIDRRATNKKKLWQSVWPDWASFKVRGDKVSYKSCPNIWTLFALLWSKNLCGYFLCIFWQIFTIFIPTSGHTGDNWRYLCHQKGYFWRSSSLFVYWMNQIFCRISSQKFGIEGCFIEIQKFDVDSVRLWIHLGFAKQLTRRNLKKKIEGTCSCWYVPYSWGHKGVQKVTTSIGSKRN